ncbi:MAG: hypothetical protein V4614_19465 [Pseudomonadota bacterium]
MQRLEGPLTSARATYAMKRVGISPAQAFEVVREQSKAMVAQQEARLKETEKVLSAADGHSNVFSEIWRYRD